MLQTTYTRDFQSPVVTDPDSYNKTAENRTLRGQRWKCSFGVGKSTPIEKIPITTEEIDLQHDFKKSAEAARIKQVIQDCIKNAEWIPNLPSGRLIKPKLFLPWIGTSKEEEIILRVLTEDHLLHGKSIDECCTIIVEEIRNFQQNETANDIHSTATGDSTDKNATN